METFYFQITTALTVCSNKMINGIVAKIRRVPRLEGTAFAYYLDARVSHTTFVYFYWKRHKESMMLP